jgi:hypothetical protein
MSPAPFTMQLRNTAARQARKLVHHHEQVSINGRSAVEIYLNAKSGKPKTITLLRRQHHAGQTSGQGRSTPKSTDALRAPVGGLSELSADPAFQDRPMKQDKPIKSEDL